MLGARRAAVRRARRAARRVAARRPCARPTPSRASASTCCTRRATTRSPCSWSRGCPAARPCRTTTARGRSSPGLEGTERNALWERLDDRTRPGYAELRRTGERTRRPGRAHPAADGQHPQRRQRHRRGDGVAARLRAPRQLQRALAVRSGRAHRIAVPGARPVMSATLSTRAASARSRDARAPRVARRAARGARPRGAPLPVADRRVRPAPAGAARRAHGRRAPARRTRPARRSSRRASRWRARSTTPRRRASRHAPRPLAHRAASSAATLVRSRATRTARDGRAGSARPAGGRLDVPSARGTARYDAVTRAPTGSPCPTPCHHSRRPSHAAQPVRPPDASRGGVHAALLRADALHRRGGARAPRHARGPRRARGARRRDPRDRARGGRRGPQGLPRREPHVQRADRPRGHRRARQPPRRRGRHDRGHRQGDPALRRSPCSATTCAASPTRSCAAPSCCTA